MKRSDFIYGEVDGDGACFFHSIAWVLTMERPNQVKKNETLVQTEKRREKLAKQMYKIEPRIVNLTGMVLIR